jgi:hypothetical protein
MCVISIVHTICSARLFSLLFIIFFSLLMCARTFCISSFSVCLYLSLLGSSFLRVKRSRRRIVSERRTSIAERGEHIRVRRYLSYCYFLSSKTRSNIKKIYRGRIRKQIYLNHNVYKHGTSTSYFK